uniref:DNA replication complex GINS protein PSF2 N-terminal domain-containing protein n=1 Tax=Neobodo designis TaxID=312471 RepID=A0A7S1R3D5_NEODS
MSGTGASAASLGVVSMTTNAMTAFQRNGFASQETLVPIVPKFNMDRLDFIGEAYGPFYPNYPAQVPLWLALYLRETNACNITPPIELTVEFLEDQLKKESESEEGYDAISTDFFDVARQLLRFAAADIPDATEVHRLVDELESCRANKINRSIGFLTRTQFPPEALFFANFASGEVESLRATFLPALNDGAELHAVAARRMTRPAAPRPSAPARSTTGAATTTDASTAPPPVPSDNTASGVARDLQESYPTEYDDAATYGGATTAGRTDTTGATSEGPVVTTRRRRTLRQR